MAKTPDSARNEGKEAPGQRLWQRGRCEDGVKQAGLGLKMKLAKEKLRAALGFLQPTFTEPLFRARSTLCALYTVVHSLSADTGAAVPLGLQISPS